MAVDIQSLLLPTIFGRTTQHQHFSSSDWGVIVLLLLGIGPVLESHKEFASYA